ncbi:MAG TPA: hypothetical protein GXZ60_11855 [Intrasporangiaceae bacterium]|nr:hypothetical protein [Intrasporangiaceae bacterium]
MTIADADLGSFAALTRALGLTLKGADPNDPNGAPNPDWFTDPVGGTGNATGLKTILSNDDQREALEEFVDEVLGEPDAHSDGEVTWLPLFRETDPDVTVYAVLSPVDGAVHLGVGVAYAMGQSAPRASVRVHVPMFQVARGTATLPARPDGSPPWLLVGTPDGRVEIGVDATFTDDAPEAAEPFLRGLSADLAIPTDGVSAPGLRLRLRDLQLPGATTPSTQTLSIDDLGDADEIGADLLAFATGLLRAQLASLDVTDPALRIARDLAGLLGLRDLPGLPPLPLNDLPEGGIGALTDWVRDVLGDDDARDAWLGQLADLVGGTPLPEQDAVSFTIGPARLVLGLRVVAGASGGWPALTPWVRLDLQTTDSPLGAGIEMRADILRADTATGTVTALPDLEVVAAFGPQTGTSPKLLASGPVRIGSVRLGLALDESRRPVPRIHLLDVDLDVGTSKASHHALLDLSSPQAALAAADSVVADVLTGVLDELGLAGELLGSALGLIPPTGVEPVAVTRLLADPLGAVAEYWEALLAEPDAVREVLSDLGRLARGTTAPPVAGDGTAESPWELPLTEDRSVSLALTRSGSELTCALRARLSHAAEDTALGDLTLTGEVGADLIRVDLAAGRASFLTGVRAALRLARTDATPLDLDLGLAHLSMSTCGVTADWSPASGLSITPSADLAVGWTTQAADSPVPLPLPTIGSDGTLTFQDEIDWDDVELAIGRLLLVPELAALHPFVRLLGWHGSGPHLSLAALLVDPGAAVEAWLTALVLDCEVLHVALSAISTVFSVGATPAPFGLGRRGAPYRVPIGGHPQLPGLSVWSEPPCPRPAAWQRASGFLPGPNPDGDALVAALWEVAADLPELTDLLTARPGLAAGLDALRTRTEGTDGLVGAPRPATDDTSADGQDAVAVPDLPSGVSGTVLPGYGHAMVRSMLVVDDTLLTGLGTLPETHVFVTTDRDWWLSQDPTRRIDVSAASTATSAGAVSAVPDGGTGAWFVLLPLRSATPPGQDGIGSQADALAIALRDRTTPLTLITDGGPGAAALRAASRPSLATTIGAVVTVGTPWGPLPTTTFVGPGGQALSFLEALVSDRTSVGDEQLAFFGNEYDRATALLDRMSEQGVASELTGVDAEPIRSGLPVHAVFGALTEQAVRAQLTALIEAAVSDRLEAATAAQTIADPDPTEPADDSESDDTRADPTRATTREVHVGLSLPAFDRSVGQVTLGLAADLSLVGIHADAPRVREEQLLTVALRFGVTDGWLVGGPGAARRDIEVRWMEVLLHLPLTGADATCELVLHEARAYQAYRERWVVRGDAFTADAPSAGLPDAATVALPEVRLVLAEVVARLRAESTAMTTLLTTLGLVRDGGLDPTGLDRLLFDTRDFLRTAITTEPAGLVTALQTLLGIPIGPTPTTLRLGDGEGFVDIDLVTGAIEASARSVSSQLPPVTATFSLAGGWPVGGSAAPQAALTVGSADDPVRLLATFTAAGPRVDLDVSTPGESRRIPLYPAPDPAPFLELLTTTLPPLALRAVLEALRTALPAGARAVLDNALDALGLLDPPPTDPDPLGAGGHGLEPRRMRLPIGLLRDPGAHLRALRSPLAGAVDVLDALGEALAPDHTGGGWPISDEAAIGYAVVDGRLELTCSVELEQSIEGTDVELDLVGGVTIDVSGTVTPRVGASARVGGYGLGLTVGDSSVGDAGGTAGSIPLSLDLLRPAPAASVRIHPGGPGLGEVVEVAAEAAVLVALDALLAARGTGTPASTIQKVATVVDDLATGLGLLRITGNKHTVDRDLVTAFAATPGPWLLSRLPDLGEQVLTALATALGSPLVTADTTSSGTRLAYRSAPSADPTAWLLLDGAGRTMALGADIPLADIGRMRIEQIRLSSAGLSVEVTAGPLEIDLDAVTLYPLISLRAGSAGALPADRAREVRIGLATSETGTDTVELAWALDATAPRLRARTAGVPSEDAATIATRALGIAANLASGILARELESVISADAAAKLQGVVFSSGRTIDPTLIADVLSPPALLARLKKLAWNCATVGDALALTIDDVLEIALTSQSAGGQEHLGITLTLAGSGSGRRRVTIVEGSLTVELEAESSWIATPDVDEGLSIRLLRGTGPADLAVVPAVTVAGLGVRFSASGAPLLDLDSLSLDAISVRVYADVSPVGIGAGVQLVLDGLSVAPGAGGGSNPVANGIMNDVGASSGSARPTFSPSLAIQRAPGPGQKVGVSLRAGDPPGPWWVLIQRQVGPLYVERIGLDTAENQGSVTRISLLFTGQLELFGLTAAVDELALSWTGGDVLAISSWSVDLKGLAISADLSGVSISGGLLKIVEGGSTSYLGMLTGRFAAYGLSVFGGFTHHVNAQGGSEASFFIFGGFNGPIGGPPAFFLTGIAGGLGINRGLRVPDDLSDFGTYPFIRALNPAATPAEPMTELRRLAEYFPHQVGNFWFAGGVSFTSFSLIDGIAVLAVSFGSSGLDITLFGLARMALPRPGVALVSIELALLVRFSMSEGVFMIRAQLTDNSWLLRPEIRLTGGFAFAIWWKGPLAGQFVLTLGGYHPSFRVEGYPDVPRLGLVWRVSDVLVIKGGSYFALTSEALMAGVDIEASLDLGWVWAKVSFGAHGIVYFDPFSFDVRAYARISAGIHLDLWLTTISFSITIGAEIHVWGPEFAGEVTFEIGPATVPIRFGGSQRVAAQTLDWPAFVAKYLEQGSGSSARALTAITGRGTLPSSPKGQTAAESADGSASRPFRVFAEFELTITTSIPTREISVGSRALPPVEPRLAGAVTQLGLAPMGLRNLRPTMRVTLQRREGAVWKNAASWLTPLTEGIEGTSGPARIGTEAFPLGVFGAPQSSGAGTARLPSHEVVRAANSLLLVAGIQEEPPGPQLNYYRVEAGRRPLPLQSTRTTRATMVNLGRTLVPEVDTVSAALGTASTLLFEQGREPHSRLARASFRTDRAAPPLFGSLTDGLVADNGPDGQRERIEVPQGEAALPRRPVVIGFLEAGPGAAARPVHTSVADGRIKRRPAPSLDSVRSRLSTRLPVLLERSLPAAVTESATVVATAYVPRTSAATTGMTYAGSRLTAPAIQGLVGGLGTGAGLVPSRDHAPRAGKVTQARAAALSQGIRGGDVVVLECLDARYDGDTTRRPRVLVTGAARVLALAGPGVVADVEVSGQQEVPVPAGTTLIAVHAGGDLDPDVGFAGWHDGSRVARLGERAALAGGCAITVDGWPQDPVQAREVTWQPAQQLIAGAREVTTRFTRPVRSIAVALTGTGPDALPETLDETTLRLVGARQGRTGGAESDPVLVVLGGMSVLVYDVTAVPRVKGAPDTGVGITVTNGAQWAVAGVVGAPVDAATLSTRIAQEGLAPVTARVTAAEGSVTLEWIDADRRTRPVPRRAPTAKKATAKKTTAKKRVRGQR